MAEEKAHVDERDGLVDRNEEQIGGPEALVGRLAAVDRSVSQQILATMDRVAAFRNPTGWRQRVSDAWRANKKERKKGISAHLSLGAATARWWAERGRR